MLQWEATFMSGCVSLEGVLGRMTQHFKLVLVLFLFFFDIFQPRIVAILKVYIPLGLHALGIGD